MGREDSKAKVGDVIDSRYRLISMLGQGGMGQVFQAEHVGIKREVAIKLLHRELRDHEGIQERVMREAFATGRLDHPNCVSITDSGMLEGGGGTYLVMELLKGESLGDALDFRETLSVVEALSIARDILKGLEHAHALGVVHRDLKPDNVFLVKPPDDDLASYPMAKILDFGIAKLLGEAKEEAGGGDLTEAGMAIGSPTYMSPEQATGGAIDGRTDLYTLSLILYEMIGGEPPFFEPDDKVRALQRRLKEKAPPVVSPSGEAVPETLQALLQDGLAKMAKDRVADAQTYLARLDAIWAALPGVAEASAAVVLAASPEVRSAPIPVPLPVLERTEPVAAPPGVGPASLSPDVLKRLKLGGRALVGLVVVIALLAVMTRDDDKTSKEKSEEVLLMEPDYLDSASTVAPEVLAMQLTQELDRLQVEIDEGRGEAQLEPLKRLQSVWPRDARTNFLLGLAYMEKRYWGDGFKYLGSAIEYDAEFREEPALIKAAIRSLSSQSKPGMGQRFLVKQVGAAAIPYLKETVVGGSKRQKKYAARALKQLQTPDM
jgi:serine/threonine protein kinase